MNQKQRLAQNREDWFLRAIEALKAGVLKGEKVPDKVWISVGFPRGSKGRGKAIGQCWPRTASKDKNGHIFISPTLSDPVQILGVIIHELGHDIVGCEHGHRKPFSDFSRRVGLVKPWTATTPGPELVPVLTKLSEKLGTYPHAVLDDSKRKKQTTRMRLYMCEGCEQKIRAATDELDAQCNECDSPFTLRLSSPKKKARKAA